MGKLRTLAIAGTFDRLHKGHEEFISHAFKLGERVIIGLTSNNYLTENAKCKMQNAKIQLKIQNYQTRLKELKTYLGNKKLLDRAEIVKIDDVYGPAVNPAKSGVKDSEIEALVVTRETLKGARMVNKKRREKGSKPLKIIRIPLVKAEDKRRISSMRIRLGEIDREGRKFKIQNSKFKIKEDIRQKLKKPQGILIEGDPEEHNKVAKKLKEVIVAIRPVLISTVGDEVTKLCNEIGITPNLALFDFKVRRIKVYKNLSDLGFPAPNSRFNLEVVNPAGYITRNLVSAIKKSYKKSYKNVKSVRNPPGCITKTLIDAVRKAYKNYIQGGRQQLIKVIGEDDLAGIPAILLAPLGSIVLYGQPAFSASWSHVAKGFADGARIRRGRPIEGVVVVEVTEEKKEELMRLLTA